MEKKSNKTGDCPLQKGSRSSYQVISYKVRKELIHLVTEQGFSIYRAANDLKLNHSTAKVIVRKYRKSGTIFQRKMERNQRESISFQGSQTEHLEIPQNVIETLAVSSKPEVSSQTMPIYFWFLPLYPEVNNNSFIPYYM